LHVIHAAALQGRKVVFLGSLMRLIRANARSHERGRIMDRRVSSPPRGLYYAIAKMPDCSYAKNRKRANTAPNFLNSCRCTSTGTAII